MRTARPARAIGLLGEGDRYLRPPRRSGDRRHSGRELRGARARPATLALPEERHDQLPEAPALLEMRIARQYESANAERLIRAELAGDLQRVADDRHADAAPRQTDARPQMRLDDERSRRRERKLTSLAFAVHDARRLDEPAAHFRIDAADQPISCLPRFGFSLADDDMAAQPVAQLRVDEPLDRALVRAHRRETAFDAGQCIAPQ